MSAPNTQGRKMFFDDVEKTYGRIRTRCAEIAAEEVTEQPMQNPLSASSTGVGTCLLQKSSSSLIPQDAGCNVIYFRQIICIAKQLANVCR